MRRSPRRSPATSSRRKRATAMPWRRTPRTGMPRSASRASWWGAVTSTRPARSPSRCCPTATPSASWPPCGCTTGARHPVRARSAHARRAAAAGRWREALDGLLAAFDEDPDAARSIDGRHLLDPRRGRAGGRVPPEARRPPLLSGVEGARAMTDVHDRIREFWDRDSATYDHSASHAVSDPLEAAAWRAALRRALPDPPASVLDVGAGTGSLSLLAAELRYEVTALDLSEGMLSKAREKADAPGARARVRGGVGDVAARRSVRCGHGTARALDDARSGRGAARVAPGDRAGRAPGALRGRVGLEGSRRPREARRGRRAARGDGHRRPPPRPVPDDVLEALPLARMPSPAPLVQAVYDAGYTGVRIQRLRDVEWAASLHEPWPLGWLEHVPRYALIADNA